MPKQRVYLIFEENFGDELYSIPPGEIWIIGTPGNLNTVTKARAVRSITTFTPRAASSETIADLLDTIELHHGPFSTAEAYTDVEIIGAGNVPTVVRLLRDFGFENVIEANGRVIGEGLNRETS